MIHKKSASCHCELLKTARRSTIQLILLFAACFFLTSCLNSKNALYNIASEDVTSSDFSQSAEVAQSDMWCVKLLSAELTDCLTATLAALQYGGDIVETTSEITPENGNTFLLLELDIEKTGTGRASFSWSDAHITDENRIEYYRHPNDTFLSNLNIPRLKGTDIVLGHESGYVCFEIPINAAGLRFIADEGNITIEVNP